MTKERRDDDNRKMESKRSCSKECGRHVLVVTIRKKESIETISTKM